MSDFLLLSSAFMSKYSRKWRVEAVHFTDLISGRAEYRSQDVPLEDKVACVREAIDIMFSTGAKIIQQSGYPRRVNELREQKQLDWLPAGLRSDNVKDVTLGFLLHHLDAYLARAGGPPAVVLIEEHGARTVRSPTIDSRFTSFPRGQVRIVSKALAHIQFADLSAYGYSRAMRNSAAADIGDGQKDLWLQFLRLDVLRWSADMTMTTVSLRSRSGRHDVTVTPIVRRKGSIEISPDDPRFYG